MTRILLNSIQNEIELISLDLLILEAFGTQMSLYGQRIDLNGEQGVSFESGTVVGYYPMLKDRKQAITARLKKLVSKNILWENQSVYGYGMKAKALYGALEYQEKEEANLEDVIKAKKAEFLEKMQATVKDKRVDLLKAGWPLGKELGRTELNKFYSYWTEPLVKHPNKLRWEDERSFEVFRRLLNWWSNYQSRNQGNGEYEVGVKSQGS